MLEKLSNSAEVRFLDFDQTLRNLRLAAAEAKARYPEITTALLFGSLVEGNWTADSDADLIVVVRRDFPDLLSRSPYQIFSKSIPTDTLVYSESEFARLAADADSGLGRSLQHAIEL
jgi:predicted nucleotidyltransferase